MCVQEIKEENVKKKCGRSTDVALAGSALTFSPKMSFQFPSFVVRGRGRGGEAEGAGPRVGRGGALH